VALRESYDGPINTKKGEVPFFEGYLSLFSFHSDLSSLFLSLSQFEGDVDVGAVAVDVVGIELFGIFSL
jgi:hypothetical protein